MKKYYILLVVTLCCVLQAQAQGDVLPRLQDMTPRGVSAGLSNLHNAPPETDVTCNVQQKALNVMCLQVEIKRYRTRESIFVGGLLVAALLLASLIYIVALCTRRNRILAETNKNKDRFFSIISHDLKNPAIAQRNALQTLIEYSDNWDADSLSRYYAELLRSADGQVELLYNLLNWAQVQTGRKPYHPAMFDLVSSLCSDLALIRNMAERKGIAFDVRMPDEAVVTGDSNMLLIVVRNLLTNAVKFTDKGDSVSLEITPAEKDTYTVSVCDTGIGMSPAQQKTLFDIHHNHNYTRHNSRPGTAGEQGSGLGLIVCCEFLEKHGSALHVESEEGKGSRFLFVI